jgi:hypothetical protein
MAKFSAIRTKLATHPSHFALFRKETGPSPLDHRRQK